MPSDRSIARGARALIAVAIGLACAQAAAQADPEPVYPGTGSYKLARRTALVIGVDSVQDGSGFPSLRNPVNDAIAVTQVLRDLKFYVIAPHENRKPKEMTRQVIKMALYDFATTLKSDGGVGLIYFSGHGVEKNSRLYLAPYDAYVQYARDLREELISVDFFYDAFQHAGNSVNFLIVDACRDYPWSDSMIYFGMAPSEGAVREEKAVIRSLATLSGKKARDGDGRLSPFAAAFVESLKGADLNLLEVFVHGVGGYLENQGDGLQIPKLEINGARDFVFRPTIQSFNRELAIFQTGRRDMLKQLTTVYAGGYFYRVARELLDNGPPDPPAKPAAVASSPRVREFSSAAAMAFDAGRAQGTEVLSPASLEILKTSISGGAGSVIDVDIVGSVPKSTDGQKASQRLVQRQAAIIQTLKDLNFDVSKVKTSMQDAPDAASADAVSLVVRSKRP